MSDSLRLIERFHTAVDLWVTGVTLRRQAIRRDRPEATPQEVEELVNLWLQERPGAETGDGPQADRPGRT